MKATAWEYTSAFKIDVAGKGKTIEMEEILIAERQAKESALNVAGGKFLSFFLGDEEYAIEIFEVQEIIGLIPITPVPKLPEYIRGIFNLRGKIIPVMDLRLRFGLPSVEDTDETCVIVLREENSVMGVLVDKVSEVAGIKSEEIEDMPSFGISGNSQFLMGIGKVKTAVKMILNANKLLFDVPDELLETSEQEA